LTKLTHSPAQAPAALTELWSAALNLVRHQTTQEIYDLHLRDSRVDASSNGVLRVAVGSDASVYHLTRMTRNLIAPALRSLGHTGPIEFVTHGATAAASASERAAATAAAPLISPAGEGASIDLGRSTSPSPAGQLQPADRILSGDVAAIARYDLAQNNWTKHSRYLRFWVPLFNGLSRYGGGIALPAWQTIRDQFDISRLDADWTPPLTTSAGEWAALLGCRHQKLLGVWRGCAAFDATLAETGAPPAQCGGCYARIEAVGSWPARTKATPEWPDGRPTCRHWVPGVLETLAQERWAYVIVRGATSDSAITVQVYLHPPLLTPQQAEVLPAAVAAAHERSLAGEHGIDLATWRQIDALRMVDLHQSLAGLELHKVGKLCATAQSSFFLRLHSVQSH
jgi:hypothetical protein